MILNLKQLLIVNGAGGCLPNIELVGKVYYDTKKNKYCFNIFSNGEYRERRCCKSRNTAIEWSEQYRKIL